MKTLVEIACNNNNMRNPSLNFISWGYACCYCCMQFPQGFSSLVGELLKYGGSGMVSLSEQLFSVVWHEEAVPRQWREGLIVNLFKKGNRGNLGNYRGITLLSVVGKMFCKVLNNRLVLVFR